MTSAEAQPQPIMRADADWFASKYADGADSIKRWKAAGEIVIVEGNETGGQTCERNSNKN